VSKTTTEQESALFIMKLQSGWKRLLQSVCSVFSRHRAVTKPTRTHAPTGRKCCVLRNSQHWQTLCLPRKPNRTTRRAAAQRRPHACEKTTFCSYRRHKIMQQKDRRLAEPQEKREQEQTAWKSRSLSPFTTYERPTS